MAASNKNSTGAIRPELVEFVLKERLLFASALGLAASSVYLKRLPPYSYEDGEVLLILWSLFAAIKGLERSGFFPFVAGFLSRGRGAGIKFVLATAILSTFVTNDVAVLIVVPLVLRLDIERKDWLVVLVISAANAGSALTPFGNPQNLFIYWFYKVSLGSFVGTIAPLVAVLSAVLLLAAGFTAGKIRRPQERRPRVHAPGALHLYVFLLAVTVGVILKLLPIGACALVLLCALLGDRRSLKVDYALLLTFACFFGLTGNLKSILAGRLEHPGHVFLFSAFLSQFMSNVPATLLLADFTTDWKALLLGVSVGGFGSLVASLANLIGYRLYVRSTGPEQRNGTRFLILFHAASYTLFVLGILFYYILYGGFLSGGSS